MSKTPRVDDREFAAIDLKPSSRVVYASFARQLETELADARAEIERLKLVSQNQETVIAAQRRSAKAKNELIEQMREALKNECLNHCEERFSRDCPPNDCRDCKNKAALEAAERGEG